MEPAITGATKFFNTSPSSHNCASFLQHHHYVPVSSQSKVVAEIPVKFHCLQYLLRPLTEQNHLLNF